MELDCRAVLRYLGAAEAGEDLRRQVEAESAALTACLTPRWVLRVFPLDREEGGVRLRGTQLLLPGTLAGTMLAQCHSAALLLCTLGPQFDALLRRRQVRDMAGAVILDACGGVWVEAGCDRAEEELRALFPGQYLTDRFSPGYGDLPLTCQRPLCAALDAQRQLGVEVLDSFLLNPVKTVTAVIGISHTPQPARVRGCSYCQLRDTCPHREGGHTCAT